MKDVLSRAFKQFALENNTENDVTPGNTIKKKKEFYPI